MNFLLPAGLAEPQSPPRARPASAEASSAPGRRENPVRRQDDAETRREFRDAYDAGAERDRDLRDADGSEGAPPAEATQVSAPRAAQWFEAASQVAPDASLTEGEWALNLPVSAEASAGELVVDAALAAAAALPTAPGLGATIIDPFAADAAVKSPDLASMAGDLAPPVAADADPATPIATAADSAPSSAKTKMAFASAAPAPASSLVSEGAAPDEMEASLREVDAAIDEPPLAPRIGSGDREIQQARLAAVPVSDLAGAAETANFDGAMPALEEAGPADLRTEFLRTRMEAPSGPTNAASAEAARQVGAALRAEIGAKTVDVRLDPPELGKVRISFQMDRSDAVTAVLTAEKPEVLDMLRRHADDLARELSRAGFQSVSLSFGTRYEGDRDAAGGEAGGRGSGDDAAGGMGAADVDSPTRIYVAARPLSRLDRLV